MKCEITEYVTKGLICQQGKHGRLRLTRLFNPLLIPMEVRPCDEMNFLFGLPQTPNGFDNICVIVDKLTKKARFLLVKVAFTFAKLTKLYIDKDSNSI